MVINLSVLLKSSQELEEAFRYAQEHDVVLVIGAGNNNREYTDYPGTSLDNVLVVGASILRDQRWVVTKEVEGTPLTQGSNYGSSLSVVGPASVTEHARLFRLKVSTVSDSITSLERKKLVVPHPPEHGRRIEISVTSLWKSLAKKQSKWTWVFTLAVSSFSYREKILLFSLSLRIIAKLVEQGIIAEARLRLTCRYFLPFAHTDKNYPHHCALLVLPLSNAHLRVDCPDQQPIFKEEINSRLQELQREAV